MSAPEVATLVGLMRRYASLAEHLHREENRLGEPGLVKDVNQSLKASIRFTKSQMTKLYQQIEHHIDNHPQLKADKALLESIPGIGALTALWILAELPDVNQFASADSAAAYAGINPCEYRSGTSVRKKTRLSKRGNAYLRRALYMPAMVAARFNPVCRALYERLIGRGLVPKLPSAPSCASCSCWRTAS